MIRFEPAMRKVDRIVKGLGAGLTLSVCLSMTAQSGGCLNPALGIAQSIYMISLDNRDGSGRGTTEAKYMWVYIVGPLVGSIFAAIFFILHDYIEKNEYKQNSPVQFLDLRDTESEGNKKSNEGERSKVWS